jgi:hypothetical protein
MARKSPVTRNSEEMEHEGNQVELPVHVEGNCSRERHNIDTGDFALTRRDSCPVVQCVIVGIIRPIIYLTIMYQLYKLGLYIIR